MTRFDNELAIYLALSINYNMKHISISVIKNYNEENNEGYFLDVDVEYI